MELEELCNRNTTTTEKNGKGKKRTRQETLEKKKSIDEVIKAASAQNDPLSAFPEFRSYSNDGLSVYLESGRGDKLTSSVKKYIQNLLKINLEGRYGSEWAVEEKVKRRELVAPAARYIFVYEVLNASASESSTTSEVDWTISSSSENRGPMVGFVHYRFVTEDDLPLLYVYELQLESHVQGKGLGKFLMQLIETIAQKNHLVAVLPALQKANSGAIDFYTSNLRFVEDSQDANDPSDAHLCSDDEDDTTVLTTMPSEEKKRTRGPTQMNHITRLQQDGGRIVLEFDDKGNALGREGDELQSYIGVLVRKHIPINIITWKQVPKSLKDKIWAEITAAFVIEDKRKKAQLVSAGEKWRKFKAYLTANFVKDKKDDPLITIRPPELIARYKNIEEEHWKGFVSQRLTEEFKKQSADQSARRKMYKTEHKLSRKGYSKLEREMLEESGPEARIDRCDLWKRAHQDKKGEYTNETVRTVVDRIDSLSEQVTQGLFKPEGKVDVLSVALGTTEHPGRVRAQPQFVRQKDYFESNYRSNASLNMEMVELKASIGKLSTALEQLQKQVDSQKQHEPCPVPEVAPVVDCCSSKASSTANLVAEKGYPNVEGTGEDDLCMLTLVTTNNVVATGKAYLNCGPNTLLHGMPLGDGNLRVAVDVPIQPDVELPFPTEEFQTISDARGGHVAWPADFVLFVTKERPTKKHKKVPATTIVNRHSHSGDF